MTRFVGKYCLVLGALAALWGCTITTTSDKDDDKDDKKSSGANAPEEEGGDVDNAKGASSAAGDPTVCDRGAAAVKSKCKTTTPAAAVSQCKAAAEDSKCGAKFQAFAECSLQKGKCVQGDLRVTTECTTELQAYQACSSAAGEGDGKSSSSSSNSSTSSFKCCVNYRYYDCTSIEAMGHCGEDDVATFCPRDASRDNDCKL